MESDVRPSKRLRQMKDIEKTNIDEFANYDVFISHRGPDTKTGFVSFLCRDLESAGLQTFLDCKSIDIGEDAWECIEHAIKKTRIAVVVFSENFAASEWCLRELDVILGTPDIKVVPIFYNVRPSEVGFIESSKNRKLQEDFEKLSGRHDKTVIDRWRGLKEVSKRMGWEHPRDSKRLEAEFLSDIVREILALANKPLPLDVGGYVVGVKQVAEEIIETVENKKDVLMLGLWGMGGIGKSTLARELYNQMSTRYGATCYIEDVTEMVNNDGVVKVQQQMMKDLCKNGPEDISGKSKGKRILRERLCKTRFLLVLDDVRDNEEMGYWISSDMFTEGSMCIITSRDRNLFETAVSFDVEREVHIHDVQGLSITDSEGVLKTYAFGGRWKMKSELEELERLVPSMSKGCGGVPLVLKVIGARLRNKRRNVWEEVMAKLNEGTIMDEKKIFECLRISYDDLSTEQQEMFLDIACALIGERKDLAVLVWKSLKWSAELGICSLIEKALITVDEEVPARLKMHDHLRDMGREIVRKKRAEEGIIRRLWMPESLSLLDRNEQLPSTLQTLNISFGFRDELRGYKNEFDVSHMMDLRILMCNGCLKLSSTLPRSIRWYRHMCPHGEEVNFPILSQNNEMAILEFFNSKFHGVLESLGELSNLEVLNLEGCWNLTMLPHSFGGLKKMQYLTLRRLGVESLPESLGELSNLEVLNLEGCWNLTMLPHSFGGLKKMQYLTLSGSGVESLPESFGELSNLEDLNLSECENLTMLPLSFGGLKKMQKLTLYRSGIESLPESFGELSNLEGLNLFECENLFMLPHSFGGLKKMQYLTLSGSGVESLPESFGELSNLEELNLGECKILFMLPHSFGGLKKMQYLTLSGSGVESLPESFGELNNLEELNLGECKILFMLPHSFGGLKKMQYLTLSGSGVESLPESFGELSNLEELDLSGCENLTMLPHSFGELKKMQKLKLKWTGIDCLPEPFGELSNLEELDLSGCENLTMLPHSFGGLKKMQKLMLHLSGIESLPESFGELSNLEELNLSSCWRLSILPDSFGGLKKMRKLMLIDLKIESLPESFGELSNLEVLNLKGCRNLTTLPHSFGCLKKVSRLDLNGTGIERLPESFGELSNWRECEILT